MLELSTLARFGVGALKTRWRLGVTACPMQAMHAWTFFSPTLDCSLMRLGRNKALEEVSGILFFSACYIATTNSDSSDSQRLMLLVLCMRKDRSCLTLRREKEGGSCMGA